MALFSIKQVEMICKCSKLGVVETIKLKKFMASTLVGESEHENILLTLSKREAEEGETGSPIREVQADDILACIPEDAETVEISYENGNLSVNGIDVPVGAEMETNSMTPKSDMEKFQGKKEECKLPIPKDILDVVPEGEAIGASTGNGMCLLTFPNFAIIRDGIEEEDGFKPVSEDDDCPFEDESPAETKPEPEKQKKAEKQEKVEKPKAEKQKKAEKQEKVEKQEEIMEPIEVTLEPGETAAFAVNVSYLEVAMQKLALSGKGDNPLRITLYAETGGVGFTNYCEPIQAQCIVKSSAMASADDLELYVSYKMFAAFIAKAGALDDYVRVSVKGTSLILAIAEASVALPCMSEGKYLDDSVGGTGKVLVKDGEKFGRSISDAATFAKAPADAVLLSVKDGEVTIYGTDAKRVYASRVTAQMKLPDGMDSAVINLPLAAGKLRFDGECQIVFDKAMVRIDAAGFVYKIRLADCKLTPDKIEKFFDFEGTGKFSLKKSELLGKLGLVTITADDKTPVKCQLDEDGFMIKTKTAKANLNAKVSGEAEFSCNPAFLTEMVGKLDDELQGKVNKSMMCLASETTMCLLCGVNN